MAEEKQCPLRITATILTAYIADKSKMDESEGEKVAAGTLHCGKDKCAWWDERTGECAILAIARFGVKRTYVESEE